MVLKKVHRVLSFKQSNFLKKYIDECTLKRQASETDFGKRLWKLYSNSVFGKFIERTRGYLDCKILLNKESFKKWISNPRFVNFKIVNEETVIVFLNRTSVPLNKAYAIGFSILELAKYFMYQQYYEVVKPTLGDCEVLMSDTDSLVLYVKSHAKRDSVSCLGTIMDFSNYPKTDERFSDKNKKKLGFWSDELEGNKMTEFCGLRSKTYAFLLDDKKKEQSVLHSKCKGVTKSYRKKITFANYKNCVETFSKFDITQFQIRSINHKVYTSKINKLCFSSYDDKRYIMKCGVHSVPYGSMLIKKSQASCPLCKIYNPLK